MSFRFFPEYIYHLICTCCLVFVATVAQAQQSAPIPDPALELKLGNDLDNRRREVEDYRPRGAGPKQEEAQPAGGPCFHVEKITVSGTTVLQPEFLGGIIAEYVPGCLQGADIQAVMRALDGAYAEQGYITSKTYIPPQNIASGVLTLSVLEGHVEGLFLVDANGLVDSAKSKLKLATAFPDAQGSIFQLRDFEQGLDQMNRLKSVDAKMRLQPGEKPGGSNIIVQRLQKDKLRGHLALDNQGSETTGRNTIALNLEADDVLGLNDTWAIGYSGSLNTNALSLSGSLPYGYLTFNIGATYSEYLTPLTQLAELFGRSKSFDFGVNYMARRDQTSTTELFANLAVKKSERFVNAAALTPQNLTSLKFGIKHIAQNGQVKNAYDGAIKLGITAFGADEDSATISASTPRAQFLKLEGGWFRLAPLGKGGKIIHDLRAQYSNTPLYSAEKISLGSNSTVRGYATSEAYGDVGVYLRNDIYFNPEIFSKIIPSEQPNPIINDLSPYAFLDAGVTYDQGSGQKQAAMGMGFGISYQNDRISGSASIEAPLISNNKFTVGDPLLRLKIDVKLF